MLDFKPKTVYFQGILLHYFIQKKSAAEAHRIFVETYSDHALHLVGSAGCSLLWAAQINWNHHGRLLSTTIDASELSIEERMVAIWTETRQWFCNMITLGHMLQNRWKPTWKHLNGKSYHVCCIHQTLPCPIISYSEWWHIVWLSSSSFILMKMSKNWLTCAWPQKTCSFFNMELKCCQKVRKK